MARGRTANDGRGRLGGRQKGTPNKKPNSQKEWIRQFLSDNREQIAEDWKKLSPKERWTMYEKLTQYVVPKVMATRVELSQMTDEQLDEVIAEITGGLNDEDTIEQGD